MSRQITATVYAITAKRNAIAELQKEITLLWQQEVAAARRAVAQEMAPSVPSGGERVQSSRG